MEIYDVLIVGAGPAGAMAGYHLAKAGLNVLILEKTRFPRRKVCGGALTQKTKDELPFDIKTVIDRAVDRGYLGFQGQTICAIHAASPIAYLVDRASFDQFLLNKAVEQGAACCQQARVVRVSQNASGVVVHTRDSVYHGRFLIGADGVHSLVAQQCRIRKPSPTSLCYEARMMLPENPTENHMETITFDFGTLRWGYAWIFPKQDHLNVGVFRNWPGRKTSRTDLSRFIRQHPGLNETDILDVRAFPGPLGGTPGPFHQGRILLCGDAAGLADPWLGEGIYYALASGRIAAETLRLKINAANPDLSDYTKHIRETFIKQFKFARRFALLVNLLHKTNIKLLKESETLQKMMADLFTGKRTYSQIWHDLWDDFPKLLKRLVIKVAKN